MGAKGDQLAPAPLAEWTLAHGMDSHASQRKLVVFDFSTLSACQVSVSVLVAPGAGADGSERTEDQ